MIRRWYYRLRRALAPTVVIRPEEDLIAKVNKLPKYSTVLLADGVYRVSEPVQLKTGQTIQGAYDGR